MQFNKLPEWGARFQFPENFHIEYDGMQGKIENQIVVTMAEKYDNFVAEQIAMEARASGVSDLTVLNKAAILEALERRTPRKPIRANRIIIKNGTAYLNDDNEYWKCPMCTSLDVPLLENQLYCHNCGQAIDWRADNA